MHGAGPYRRRILERGARYRLLDRYLGSCSLDAAAVCDSAKAGWNFGAQWYFSVVKTSKTPGSPQLGRNKKIDIVLYDERSVYGLNRVIRESTDPVAQSIAISELLDLLHLQNNPPPDPSSVLIQLAGNGTNATAGDLAARRFPEMDS